MNISKQHYSTLKSVMDEYGAEIIEIIPVRSAYKVKTDKGVVFLKRFKHSTKKVKKVEAVIRHLKQNGFTKTPLIIYTTRGKIYVKKKNYYYYMTECIEGEECNFSNLEDVKYALELLAEFHKASVGIDDDKADLSYKYVNIKNEFIQKLNDFEYFVGKIAKRKIRNEFDKLYLDNIDKFANRGETALEIIKDCNLYEEVLCHDSFYYQNLLKTNDNTLYIVDLDQCSKNIKSYDLAKFIRRMMSKKEYNWDFEKAKYMIDEYSKINNLCKDDIKSILAVICFPHKFWKLGSKRYRKNKLWTEERYLKKLNAIIKESSMIDAFIKKYMMHYEI